MNKIGTVSNLGSYSLYSPTNRDLQQIVRAIHTTKNTIIKDDANIKKSNFLEYIRSTLNLQYKDVLEFSYIGVSKEKYLTNPGLSKAKKQITVSELYDSMNKHCNRKISIFERHNNNEIKKIG